MKTSYWTAALLAAILAGCNSQAKHDCDSEHCMVGDVEDSDKGHHDVTEHKDADHKDVEDNDKDEKHEGKADDKDVKIEAAALPAVITTAFNTAHPGATIKEVIKEDDNGATHYEIKFSDSSGDHEVEFDDKGAVVPD